MGMLRKPMSMLSLFVGAALIIAACGGTDEAPAPTPTAVALVSMP